MGNTATLALPYPELAEPADVPADMKQLADALDTLAPGYAPVGAMLMWPTAAAPTGWLLCNGAQVSATTYPKLATVLGSAGGLITVPNLTQRLPVGAGGTYALGATGGEATHALTLGELAAHTHNGPSHTHAIGTLATDTEPDHVHGVGSIDATTWRIAATAGGGFLVGPTLGTAGTTGGQNPSDVIGLSGSTAAAGAHAHALTGAMGSAGTGATGSAGSGTAHNNLPPYLVVNFIIRAV